VHTGRPAEHDLQVREGRQRVEIRVHEREVFDVLQVIHLRPDANGKLGDLFLERVAPCLRIADPLVEFNEKQRHTSTARSTRLSRDRPYFASLCLIPELSTSFATRGRSAANSRACASGDISSSGNGTVPRSFSFATMRGSETALRSAV